MYLYTSYFYQIRFFKPYMIPFSTAVWDPKWYHDFKSQNYNFLDRNGVINGLRLKNFMPGEECDDLCRGIEVCPTRDPEQCPFLKVYEKQLRQLSKEKVEAYFNKVCKQIAETLQLNREAMPILIVHEAPSNPCSERRIIHKVMNSIGIPTTELSYPIKDNY